MASVQRSTMIFGGDDILPRIKLGEHIQRRLPVGFSLRKIVNAEPGQAHIGIEIDQVFRHTDLAECLQALLGEFQRLGPILVGDE